MKLLLTYAALLVCFTSHAYANDALDAALAAQSDDQKERYQYRNPKETLEFFDVKPGTTVAEALPGGGWYSKILMSYLGNEGELVGLDYSLALWPNFGGFVDDAFMEKKKTWTVTWPEQARGWGDDSSAKVSAAVFGDVPESMNATVDTVLFIRAMHNIARFADKGDFLNEALADAFAMLKPGGTLGIVQHQALEDRPDDWANGSNGYLKKSFMIEAVRSAGFDYIGDSDINANPKDQAGEGDIVWRLPPSLRGADEDEELEAKMTAIGESNRMTLKFRKPS